MRGLKIIYNPRDVKKAFYLALGIGAAAAGVADYAFNSPVTSYVRNKILNPQPIEMRLDKKTVSVDAEAMMKDGLGIWDIANANLKSEGKPFNISEYTGPRADEIMRLNQLKDFNDIFNARTLKLPDDNGDGHALPSSMRKYEIK